MSFDTLAPHYRSMEFLMAGGILQRCRTAFLAETAYARRALLLGEGPGRFLVRLVRTNPRVEVVCVEQSSRMIREARGQLTESEIARVQFVQADALTWRPLSRPDGDRIPRAESSRLEPLNRSSRRKEAHSISDQDSQSLLTSAATRFMERDGERGTPESQEVARRLQGGFDLIVTHFFLDCFRQEELEGLIARIAGGAANQARWLLSDFRLPERGWKRVRARAVLALMYGFFRRVTNLSATRLTPPDEFLEAAGFRRMGRRLANFDFVYSDLWQRDQR